MFSPFGNTTFSHEQYTAIEEIGRGGMGVLLKCRDERMNIDVAVKVLGWNFSNEEVIRFQQEAQALAQLRHPNIVNIFHFGHSNDDSLFIVMELLKGQTLDALIDQSGTLEFDDALDVFIQICDGLAHAHGKGILHRDIKPSNIFFERKSNNEIAVTITDFGLAKLLTEDQRLTKTNVSLGSPPYMSPEQIDGKSIDDRADVYSLGCLMFNMLTGQPPFAGQNAQSILLKHMKDKPPLLRQQSPERNFPEEMERIISKCLNKDPNDRYTTIKDLRDDLQKLREQIKAQAFAEADSRTVPQPILKIGDLKQSLPKTILLMVVILIPAVLLVAFGFNKFLTKEKQRNVTQEITKSGEVESVKIAIRADGANYNLKDEHLDDNDLKAFSTCTAAKTIDLSNTSITDTGLKYLSNCSVLRSLYLNDTRVKTLEFLPAQKSLRELQLKGTQVTDESLLKLMSFPRLVGLDVRDTKITTDGLLKIRKRKLFVLKIDGLSKEDFDRLQIAWPFCVINEQVSFGAKLESEIDDLIRTRRDIEAQAACDAWIKIARERRDTEMEVFFMTIKCQSLDAMGKIAEADVLWEETIKLGERTGHEVRLVNAYDLYIKRSAALRRKDPVLKYVWKAVDLRHRITGDDAKAAEQIALTGMRVGMMGQIKVGIEVIEKAIKIQQSVLNEKNDGTTHSAFEDDEDLQTNQLLLVRFKLYRASLLRENHELDKARKEIEESKALIKTMDETFAAEITCLTYIAESQLDIRMKLYEDALKANEVAAKVLEEKLSKNNNLMIEVMFQRRDILRGQGHNREADSIDATLRSRLPPAAYAQRNAQY